MEQNAVRTFVNEILWHAEISLKAWSLVQASASAGEPADNVYHHLSSFLAHAGIVSLLLYPGKKADQDRGQYLRELLGVVDEKMSFGRALRNSLEHIDERLDSWVKQNHSRVDMNYGPVGSITDEVGRHAGDLAIRHFDDSTNIYYFTGEPFPLNDVVNSLQDIVGACRSKAEFYLLP